MTYETLQLDRNEAVNQMQDERVFCTGVTGAFQSYALTRMYRLQQGKNTTEGAKRARERDAAFDDNR